MREDILMKNRQFITQITIWHFQYKQHIFHVKPYINIFSSIYINGVLLFRKGESIILQKKFRIEYNINIIWVFGNQNFPAVNKLPPAMQLGESPYWIKLMHQMAFWFKLFYWNHSFVKIILVTHNSGKNTT